MTKNVVAPTRFPVKCRTADGRDRLLDYLVKAIRASLEAFVRSQQYATVTPLGAPPRAFEVQHRSNVALVECVADSAGKGFVVKVWVNGRESSLERLPNAIRAAWSDSGDDADDDE